MKRNGFTLLEMLVALAVFSIAALALLRLDAIAVRTAADLSTREGLLLVAENEAAVIATDPSSPPLGRESRSVVNGGRTFKLSRTATATPDPRLVRIDLAVTEDGATGTVRLTFIRRTA